MAEDETRQHLSKVEIHKSLIGPAGVRPQVLRELAGGLVRPIQKEDVPENLKKANTVWADGQCSGRKTG